jgi:hypothetical protein
MASEYTTVMDAGSGSLPALPLILMLAAPILMLACLTVAKARRWQVSRPIRLALWAAYAAYAPVVMFQYWSLWDAQQMARNATAMSVEAGRLDWSNVRQAPEGIFVDTNQRFAVNGVEFQYNHRSLRYLDFLVPQADLVSLPLFQRAQVRVTYCGEGEGRRLLRFEIATSALDANDWPMPESAALSN